MRSEEEDEHARWERDFPIRYFLVRDDLSGGEEGDVLWGRCAQAEGLFVDPSPVPREVLTLRGCPRESPLGRAVAAGTGAVRLLGDGMLSIEPVDPSNDGPGRFWDLEDTAVLAQWPTPDDHSRLDIVVGTGLRVQTGRKPLGPGRQRRAFEGLRATPAPALMGIGSGVSVADGHNSAVDLRPELLPPPVSQQRLDELCAEVERIAELLETRPEVAGEAIAAFNTMTGHGYVALDFAEYHGSRSLAEFAREAARPARPTIADITRDELVEIVHRLLTAASESNYYLRLLEANVPHPRVSDLVFHPSEDLQGASAEQIVNKALKYRPIVL
ncbi:hypothetical protein ACWC1D_27255 [Streptomyces sp. NPDC001478]